MGVLLKTDMEKKEVKPRGYWDYEHCKEEALKYKKRADLQRGCSRAYKVARINGWLDEFFPKAA